MANDRLSKIYRYINDHLLGTKPEVSSKEMFYFIFLSGAYIFFFLLFFQPFGINNYDPYERITLQFALILMSIAIVNITLLAINEFLILPFILKHHNYLITWLTLHLLWLSSGIFLYYNYLGDWHDMSWNSYYEFLLNISVLGIIPFICLLIYARIKALRSSLDSAYEYRHKDYNKEQLIVFKADNLKDQFTLPLKFLIYIKSEDNYVAIYYLSNDVLTKTLLRKSLKKIQNDIDHPALLRCHRSFIINLIHLQQVQGNRNKLRLRLSHVQHQIPVSRQYIDNVYQLINDK